MIDLSEATYANQNVKTRKKSLHNKTLNMTISIP